MERGFGTQEHIIRSLGGQKAPVKARLAEQRLRAEEEAQAYRTLLNKARSEFGTRIPEVQEIAALGCDFATPRKYEAACVR